jgi:hypothetical protein
MHVPGQGEKPGTSVTPRGAFSGRDAEFHLSNPGSASSESAYDELIGIAFRPLKQVATAEWSRATLDIGWTVIANRTGQTGFRRCWRWIAGSLSPYWTLDRPRRHLSIDILIPSTPHRLGVEYNPPTGYSLSRAD